MLFSAVPSTPGDPAVRRRSVPGIRAVAGGGLVALAMLGVLVAPGEAETALEQYVVATDDIAPGTALADAPLEPMAMQIPALVADRAVGSLGDLDEATSRTAISRGAIVLTDDVRRSPAGDDAGPEVTVTIAADRALGGTVLVGDTVDLVATYGSGTEGFSRLAAVGAVVLDVQSTASSLGIEAAVTLVLRLGRTGDILPVVHAARADALSLVRSGRAIDPDAAFVPQRPSEGTAP